MINFFLRYYSRILKKLSGKSLVAAKIHSSSKIEAGSSVHFSCMGRYSFCGYDCSIYYAEIGSFVSIAGGVVIGAPEHPMSWVSTSPVFYRGRDSIKKKFSDHCLPNPNITLVGNDVWIGSGAVILSGVSIGDGAVIGAGSIVTKNVDPYAIVAGSPAKLIRYRFSNDIINRLLRSEWWLLPDDRLSNLAKYIKNPEVFLKRF